MIASLSINNLEFLISQRNDLLSHQRRNVCGSLEKNENESVLQDAI